MVNTDGVPREDLRGKMGVSDLVPKGEIHVPAPVVPRLRWGGPDSRPTRSWIVTPSTGHAGRWEVEQKEFSVTRRNEKLKRVLDEAIGADAEP
jgi:hypothetical protein